LPPSDEELRTFPAGATAEDLLEAVDEGLATPGHGPGQAFFVVFRDGARHGAGFRPGAFHAVIGAGVTLPEGALVVRRAWLTSGQIDGVNEELERCGISVAVEPGGVQPYGPAVRAAAAAFTDALARRVPIHPDCVVAMGEVPFAREHASDAAERELAKAARERVPVPPVDGTLVIRSGGREIRVDFERRSTADAIHVGMMMRSRFDGEDRGMLFEYAYPNYREFWMRNCRIPIDVAYINGGKIEEIHSMEPAFGERKPRRYESKVTAKYALEVPGGWFTKRGVLVGDTVEIPPPPAKSAAAGK
jgi:hypothetical protein